MGNQQAHRTVNEQVAGCGPREAVTAAVFAGCRAAHRRRSRAAGCACAAGADCGTPAVVAGCGKN